jgi:predicted alpha/beta-fold hydrolase
MPVLNSRYSPPRILRQGDMHTILPHYLGAPVIPKGRGVTLSLADNDEVELFVHESINPSGIAIISHGLEGSINSPYIIDTIKRCTDAGLIAVSWNMRGCGEKPNQNPYWYHSGDTRDLQSVVEWVTKVPSWQTLPLYMIGFSVGGNITLRFLADTNIVTSRIVAAVCVSVPVDLEGSAITLAAPRNRRYMKYLLAPLKERMRIKATQFPGLVDVSQIDTIKTFYDFDTRYTAPLHGFGSVEEYWSTQSSLGMLPKITTRTLLVSARDDPFLSPSCFPTEAAEKNPNFFVEYPSYGGHVGFLSSPLSCRRWISKRALDFLTSNYEVG